MNSAFEEVCRETLKRITPTAEEREKIHRLAEELRQKVVRTTREAGVEAEVRVEGSVAKETWLSDDPEIDIFMRLPTTLSRKEFEKISLKIARKATEGSNQVERFAEHPYLEAFVDGVRVNIVPCYKVERGRWKSATDRTPFHTDYVKPLLNERMRGEVRLLKRFMKGVEVYGAEIRVGGFSGYLCELLVLHYGSFKDVLEAFSSWKPGGIIDYEGYYKGREHEAELLFEQPLVMVDPVDEGRNVSSAVQLQKLYMFVAAARAFLKKPDTKFFYPPETTALTVKELKQNLAKRGSTLVFLTLGKVKAVPDVLWGQLYKSQRSLRKLLQRNDFNILRDVAWSDEKKLNLFIFEVEQRFISPVKKHLGPPLEKEHECERFLQKYLNGSGIVSGPYIENGRWIVELRRKYTDAANLLDEKLKDGGRNVGVAEQISQRLCKGFKILVDDEIAEVYRKNSEFAKFLTDFLFGKPKWLETNYG